jgi:hypothetical protein
MRPCILHALLDVNSGEVQVLQHMPEAIDSQGYTPPESRDQACGDVCGFFVT